MVQKQSRGLPPQLTEVRTALESAPWLRSATCSASSGRKIPPSWLSRALQVT